MTLDPEQHMVIITTREAMARQAREALATIEAANGGDRTITLREMYDIDAAAFGRLVEALVALGANVSEDMQQLAGLVPVDQAIW